MKRYFKGRSLLHRPARLPFIEAIQTRFNVRVDVAHEQTLLATYERYWGVRMVLGMVVGDERRFLASLARKYNSFIYQQL